MKLIILDFNRSKNNCYLIYTENISIIPFLQNAILEKNISSYCMLQFSLESLDTKNAAVHHRVSVGNHTVFLAEFGINLHLRAFQKAEFALAASANTFI